jgi:hypothetical protein
MGSSAPAFDRWLDGFLAWYYRTHPVDATFIGVHEYDYWFLPDCSAQGLDDLDIDMQLLREELSRLPVEALSEAQTHDRRLADGFLDIQIWEISSKHFQRGNPSYYTGEAIFSIMALFHRDSEPVEERAKSAIAGMRAIPGFLAQGRANIQSAPALWTERAIRESRSGIAYFERGIAILARERGIESEAFTSASDVAAEAFRVHLDWLESELAIRTNDDYAAGREALDRYLVKGHMLKPEQDSRWVESYARRALETAQQELEDRARQLDPTRNWREQLGDLASLHPTVDDYYERYTAVWNEAKAAAIEADLVTWPDFPIDFIPFPESDREAAGGLYYLFYRCPAPFGKPETHKYRVTPIDASMPVEEQERLLSATNDSVIKLNHVVHHGGLGHHVQNWNAFRAKSRIGKIAGVDGSSRIAFFCAGTLVEGWACYATDLAEEFGFLTPLESLSEQQSRVRMAARALADVGIHTGAMTLHEAAAFYEREAGMSPSAAIGEAVKNSMFPGAALIYLIGTQAIHDLRDEMQWREGDAFSLKRFHDRFLTFGAIPVSLIAESMLANPTTAYVRHSC